MNKSTHFIGIDVSKNTLDFSIRKTHNILYDLRVPNTEKGIKAFFKQAERYKIDTKKTLFCLEHTGVYIHKLVRFLQEYGYKVWITNPLDIKKSLGLQRGKNDKVDAQRIAEYAERYADKQQLALPFNPVVESLKHLLTLRNRLIQQLQELEVPLKEAKGQLDAATYKSLVQTSSGPIQALKASIKQVTVQLSAKLKQDAELENKYRITTSVPGIGFVTGLMLLICTHGYERIKTAKRCACYAGVVPFERTSGISIKGKSVVSHHANKKLKHVMSMGVLSAATRSYSELGSYYQRKVSSGKAPLSVLNAVKNKLIHRVYACIRDNRMYEPEGSYQRAS